MVRPMWHPRLAQVGRIIFPLRGHLGIPFLLGSLLVCRPEAEPPLALGWLWLLAGLAMRLWGVAGWVPSRLAGQQPERLITVDGPYVFCRNPRYVGNLMMGIGGCSLAGLPQCLGPYLLIWAGLHIPIVAYEESVLEGRWGEEYRQYCRKVPRFLGPTGRALRPQLRGLRWHQAFCLEMTTIAGWLSLGLFLQSWRLVGLGGSHGWFCLASGGAILIWVILLRLRSHLRHQE